MYLGSPRMAEMVIGEKVTLEEMGGARMHCSVSGCGDVLVKTEDEAIAAAKTYLSYFPSSFAEPPPTPSRRPPARSGKRVDEIIPADQNKPFDMFALINELVDAGSFFEVKKLFAQEVVTGLARIAGRPVGHRRQPAQVQGWRPLRGLRRQGARFIWLCDAFNIPAALPGRRAGLHDRHQGRARRHHPRRRQDDLRRLRGHRPSISVIVRKAYGAGLYAMSGPGFGPTSPGPPPGDDRRHGPRGGGQCRVLQQDPGEARGRAGRVRPGAPDEYRADVDLLKLASELIIDEVVPGDELRDQLERRLEAYSRRFQPRPVKKHGVLPV
jgi:acetyl-CoA carboxylase carboxyltransferase component